MRKQEQNSIRDSLSQLRHDIWMWMAWWSTSAPPEIEVEAQQQGELEYLFDNPTGNTLDFHDNHELYSISESDLEDLICDHDHNHHHTDDFGYGDHDHHHHIDDDDFGYDHLNIDNSPDLW